MWFQNRRIKWRKQHLEMQQQRLAVLRTQQAEMNDGEDTSSSDYGDSQQSLSPSPTVASCNNYLTDYSDVTSPKKHQSNSVPMATSSPFSDSDRHGLPDFTPAALNSDDLLTSEHASIIHCISSSSNALDSHSNYMIAPLVNNTSSSVNCTDYPEH